MTQKPTYEELEQRVKGLEQEAVERKRVEEALRKAHDQLELQEQERTAELVRANEKLKLEIEERKRAEQRLRKALDGLETIVEERTVAVVKAYRKLKLEIEERKRVEEELREARDELERRVEERTSELSRSNALLKRELNERKRVEEELQKKNEELEIFVHAVSHDLKNPIYAISGFSSLMLEHHQEELGEEGLTCLEHIKVNARRMEVLVSDLLALSRIGHVVSTFEEIPSIEIVKNVTSGLQDRLQEHGMELVVADNLPTIYCDGKRIYQVFENLLVNAIKFTRYSNNPKIEVGCEDMGDSYQFHVRDNGIGIDPKHHLKIFEMFHRLKEIQDEEGTGLGLAIVDRIVNNHGGKAWVESEKDKGSTFYFTLPKAPSPVTHL